MQKAPTVFKILSYAILHRQHCTADEAPINSQKTVEAMPTPRTGDHVDSDARAAALLNGLRQRQQSAW